MSKKWVALTQVGPDGNGDLYVNLDQVSSIEWNPKKRHSVIWFLAGADDGKAIVSQSPEQIFEAAKVTIAQST